MCLIALELLLFSFSLFKSVVEEYEDRFIRPPNFPSEEQKIVSFCLQILPLRNTKTVHLNHVKTGAYASIIDRQTP